MDVVFFLKAMPPKGVSIPGAKLIGLEPPLNVCGGTDPRCSSAYSALWQSLKDGQGRVLPNLLKKYAPGADRVAFVAFSAAHGFMNPLLNNDADRAGTSAVLLMDASFGGGKTGYIKAARDAAEERMLLVSATSNTGGDASWQDFVMKPGHLFLKPTSAKPPMPPAKGGVSKLGDLWYYRYDGAPPHWEFGTLIKPVLEAHLIPYWNKKEGWVYGLAALAAAAAGYFAWKRYRK